MLRLLFASVLFLFSCSNTMENTNSIELDILKLEKIESEDYYKISLKFKNNTSTPIKYMGYNKDNPVYDIQVLENGTWKSKHYGWCGTGLNDYKLDVGDKENIEITYQKGNESTRVGIYYYLGEEEKVVWSRAID